MIDVYLPPDYESPDWDNIPSPAVHEWKTYISDEVREMWPSMSVELKKALARQSQYLADQEDHWDD